MPTTLILAPPDFQTYGPDLYNDILKIATCKAGNLKTLFTSIYTLKYAVVYTMLSIKHWCSVQL